jgi:nitrous oxide reductase
MATPKNYDPCDVKVFLNDGAGAHQVSFFGEDTIVSIKPEKTKAEDKVSVCGETTRLVNSGNRMGKMTLTVMMSSPSNGVLVGFSQNNTSFAVDVQTPFENFESTNCSVEEDPDFEFGSDITEREWLITMPELVITPAP